MKRGEINLKIVFRWSDYVGEMETFENDVLSHEP